MVPLAIVVLASCAARLTGTGEAVPGDYIGQVDSRDEDWSRRSYRIHIPSRKDGSARPPLVLVLHGAFSSAADFEQRSGFSQLADAEGFVAVYPNGYGFLGLFRHWNAGHCCGRARDLGVDDIGFLDSVLDDVMRRVEVDPGRVYVVGESNGAMLAYLYAAVRPRRIAAAAAVIGSIGSGPAVALERIPPPQAPVPMLIVHGSADRTIPFHGGPSDRDPDVTWVAVPDCAAFWVGANDANAEPEITALFGGDVVRSVWHGGRDSAPVVLYEIQDWPHAWPGPEYTAALASDDPIRGFDAARIAWEFLRPHRRAPETP